ncbi:FIST N-terminal domain-containing protein [Pararhizobium haloflavum]|uniref:FIST N-terminal domain-containing protein n=1 Tax=Pararhizobium haloflavum TaxID=2037914 RepID=UPI000C195D0C|nr:FIST N-terminal domain-containing protein [Pararhizobium haloflavum]
MPCQSTTYACGIVAIDARDVSPDTFARELARQANLAKAEIASIFFSQDRVDAAALVEAIACHAPALRYAGCSTAGEITPNGYSEGCILAMLFPSASFKASALLIEDVATRRMEELVAAVEALRSAFDEKPANAGGDMFSVLLIDGLSRVEETVTSALYWSLDDIPLVGGSAGDNMRFDRTTLIHNGRVATGCAIVILVRSALPFHIFKTENFNPTAQKLVVTASDPDSRTVYEINAEPAAEAYASAIGIDPKSLTPMSFASYPVVVRVGGEYYCRSIQKMNEDGSLSFFCAIDNGIVLTIAEPMGMVESTRQKLHDVSAQLGGTDVILGFDCVLRRLDAENRQSFAAISKLYRDNNIIGFGTYGEQYRSMHLNQTFTGIAFGRQVLAAE